jgi:hypothetical protein
MMRTELPCRVTEEDHLACYYMMSLLLQHKPEPTMLHGANNCVWIIELYLLLYSIL